MPNVKVSQLGVNVAHQPSPTVQRDHQGLPAPQEGLVNPETLADLVNRVNQAPLNRAQLKKQNVSAVLPDQQDLPDPTVNLAMPVVPETQAPPLREAVPAPLDHLALQVMLVDQGKMAHPGNQEALDKMALAALVDLAKRVPRVNPVAMEIPEGQDNPEAQGKRDLQALPDQQEIPVDQDSLEAMDSQVVLDCPVAMPRTAPARGEVPVLLLLRLFMVDLPLKDTANVAFNMLKRKFMFCNRTF